MKRSFVVLNVPESVSLTQLQCRLQLITAQSVDVCLSCVFICICICNIRIFQIYDSDFVDKNGVYGLKRVNPPSVVQVQLLEDRQNVSAIVAVVNGQLVMSLLID